MKIVANKPTPPTIGISVDTYDEALMIIALFGRTSGFELHRKVVEYCELSNIKVPRTLTSKSCSILTGTVFTEIAKVVENE